MLWRKIELKRWIVIDIIINIILSSGSSSIKNAMMDIMFISSK